MNIEILKTLFKRDLNKLRHEIQAYTAEDNLWLTPQGISNCSGNLCLHLIGNLNAFIGAQLGQSGYIRKRALEFSEKNVPKATLISQIEDTISVVADTLEKLTEEDLSREYPLEVFKEPMSTGYFLTHLATHLTYHLGQVNYHRKLLDQ